MFNLDESIAEWRRQMVVGGVKHAEVLDELESHLREDLEERVRAGLNTQQAFEKAVQAIGQAARLECEFGKVGGMKKTQRQVKQTLFALAGIPNHYVPDLMNTSSPIIEPRWATYLKAAAFLAPALFIWGLSAVFMVPKLQEICAEAGLGIADQTFWDLTRYNIGITHLFKDHGLIIFVALIFMLILLEWRSTKWSRYRRATLGFLVFLVNLLVLLSIFMMFITAMVVAPALLHHAK